MRWKGRRGSENVEDRRSMSGPVMIGGGGGLVLLGIALLMMCMGADPRALFDAVQQVPQQPGQAPQQAPGEAGPPDEASEFVSVVLADTEEVWQQQFQEMGTAYREPTLVLFRRQVSSACGFQGAATGPFYCPLDQKVYIDLTFFDEMTERLQAPGDFARAYVIAHEVGHHVQKQLGISDKVQQLQQSAGQAEANELSVRMELQADFFAGVWAHHAQQNWNILEQGDIEEALNAATQIGDDRIQMEQRGVVVPESFTHGSSEQRVRWFVQGLKTGDVDQGDTFAVPYERL